MTYTTPIPANTIECSYDIRGGKCYACFLMKKGEQFVEAVFLTDTKAGTAKMEIDGSNLLITI